MTAVNSTMLELGTKAPPFRLPSATGGTVSIEDFSDARALLVMFICNHCPFVKHVREELVKLANDYGPKGVAVVAINSNDVDRLLAIMTDDVVFLAPNSAPIVGKAAVRPWIEGYLAAFQTHWDKQVNEFVVGGQWAFERYSYTSTDRPREGGDPVVDTGWGLVIYHHDADGAWRVARDAWGSDQPLEP
ncbi:MAG: redoxin domain-containing protein [Thermodesulfobacteriota bacterium]